MNEFLKVTIGDYDEVLRYKNRVMVLETLYTPLKHYSIIESMRMITKRFKLYIKKMKYEKAAILIQNRVRCYQKRKRYLQMHYAASLIVKQFQEYLFSQKLVIIENAYTNIALQVHAFIVRRRFLRMKRASIIIQKTFRHMKKIKLRNYANMLLKIREMEEEKKRNEITTKKLQSQITNMRRINKRKNFLN